MTSLNNPFTLRDMVRNPRFTFVPYSKYEGPLELVMMAFNVALFLVMFVATDVTAQVFVYTGIIIGLTVTYTLRDGLPLVPYAFIV